MILLVFLAALAVATVVRLAAPVLRRRRIAAELRGDWWPRFEREFQTYASRTLQAARDAERRAH